MIWRLSERAALSLLRRLAAGIPDRHAQWRDALLAEVRHIDGSRARARWAAGSALAALRMRPHPGARWWLALTALLAGIVIIDRSPSDVANQATLLALMTTAAGLGCARPQSWLLAGVLSGAAVPAAHLIYLAAGFSLPYEMKPAGLVGALSLLGLLVPGVLGAWVGRTARRGVRAED